MKNPKTVLALILAAVVLTAWAGSDGVADKPKSDSDNRAVVAPAQPAKPDEKPDQTTQSKPKRDQAPESEDRGIQAPEHRSDNAQTPRSEHNAVQSPRYERTETQVPVSSERVDRNYTEPARIQTRQSNRGASESGETNVPQVGGEPNRGGQRGDGSHGGYQGGRDRDPFYRRPSHYFGGHGWHGHHDEWRHHHFHDYGSWSFLFYFGPRIYYAPVHYPHVIRIPHERVGVYVRYTGEDAVGSAFANSVREHLREEGLRVVYSQDDARLELYVISMEQDPDDAGYNSSISVSYIWYPGHKFITAQMVDAGLNEVDDLAESVAAYADDLVDDYR